MGNNNYRQREKFDFTFYRSQNDSQLLETGKSWVDTNKFQDQQKCLDFIGALRKEQKYSVAVELSQYLFDRFPSPRNLNTLMISIVDEGDIDKQCEMLNQMEKRLIQCNVTYERNIFGTWLKTINTLVECGKIDKSVFFEVYDKCSTEDKCNNTYIISQYYVRLNADGRYSEVISHYSTIAPGAKMNTYVKRYYNTAIRNCGMIVEQEDASVRSSESLGISKQKEPPKDEKGIFIVFGRNEKQYKTVKQILNASDARIISLKETGTEGSKTLPVQVDEHIEEASYAVVLLAPDDVGYLASENPSTEATRVRENVLFEYGYVIGALGRDNVVSIASGENLKLPTDISSIRFIPLDLDKPNYGINALVQQLEQWHFKFNKEKLLSIVITM